MVGKYFGWNMEHTYTSLPELFFMKTDPTPVQKPELILLNESLANELGLQSDLLQSDQGVNMLAGNVVANEFTPISQAYAGHQFGHFTMLGDGRAILLGEQRTPKGDLRDVQLKGPGLTPYSRGGDGRAGLGPMLREYMMSEAMHALGIPTTRALAVVMTGEPVIRETVLDGAILTRVASSHLRVGTFQYAARWGTTEDIRQLADYAIARHDPVLAQEENPYVAFLKRVIDRQASLIAKWQHVGFIHGVMNTDNMTISGETIDYGPCAFMNTYDSKTVFSSIDEQGRYAYGNQPTIGGWNLARFAESLLPLFHEDEDEAVAIAQAAISEYNTIFADYWLSGMRAKLGLYKEEGGDAGLIDDLIGLMNRYEADYTNTFVHLTIDEPSEELLFKTTEFNEWKTRWADRLKKEDVSSEAIVERMKSHNPAIISRNHLVEEALEAAVEHGDFSKVIELNDVLARPYAYTKEQADFREKRVPDMPYQTYCGT